MECRRRGNLAASQFAALAGHIAACYARVWFRGDAPDTQSGAGELGGRGDGSKGPPFDLNLCGLALRLQRDRPPFTHMNRSAFVRIVACPSSACWSLARKLAILAARLE